MARTEHNPEVKAAVMAALLQGQSQSQVADAYRVPLGTVKRWGVAARAQIELVRSEKRERIGDLLLDYLTTSLETLRAQHLVFADVTWLREQPAESAAVLHGVIADKTVRLLEALRPPETEPTDGGDDVE